MRIPFSLSFFLGWFVLSNSQNIVRGPYLQSQTDTSIVVMWRTDVPTASTLWIGAAPGNYSNFVVDTSQIVNHTLRFGSLSPSTQYFYAIGEGQRILSAQDQDHYFKTAPPKGSPGHVKVLAMGDFGKGNAEQASVRDAFLNHANLNGNPDVWIWLGDNVYDNGTDQEYHDKVFDSLNGYHHVFKNQVFWPTPGNHDYNSVNRFDNPPDHVGPYYDIVNVPQNGGAGGEPSGYELYYSFDYGNVHFVSLNSELQAWTTSSTSTMCNWLKTDLQNNDRKWTIVYWHQPPYSKGSHNSDDFFELLMAAMRTNILPILDLYGVDLVLCGHSHVYERSFLIKGHYGNSSSFNPATMLVQGGSGNLASGLPYFKDTLGQGAGEGIVFANVGNSGSKETAPNLNHPIMYTGYGCDTCIGSLWLDIIGDTLSAQFIPGIPGAFSDAFSIIKMDLPTRILPEETSPFRVDFFPNPFQNAIWMEAEFREPGLVTFTFFTIDGKRVKELKKTIKADLTLRISLENELSDLESGIYRVEVEKEGAILMRKIVRIDD